MRNANLMTLVASAHRNDLDVTKYLESVITHMLRGTARVEELLPDVWKTHHPEAVQTYRVEERAERTSTAIAQAAKRRIRRELRKSLFSVEFKFQSQSRDLEGLTARIAVRRWAGKNPPVMSRLGEAVLDPNCDRLGYFLQNR